MNHRDNKLYPLLFKPVLKNYMWGGRNLESIFGRVLPPDGVIAESWDIAAHRDGSSVVENGILTGKTLTEVQAIYGLQLIGRNSQWAQNRFKFPLLVKLLDAQRRLSVQVHPDDDYAQEHESDELGKSEMWVVLHAEPDSELILGVTKGTTAEIFRKAIESDGLLSCLHRMKVSAGEFVCVPSGSLHAIMGGTVLAEIQQNSNTTYRVYDWGRANSDRPLHIEKSLDVINFDQVEPQIPTPTRISFDKGILREMLCQNRYFSVERFAMPAGATFAGFLDGSTFEIWGSLVGDAELESDSSRIGLRAIRFVLMPATTGAFTIKASRQSTLLRIYVD